MAHKCLITDCPSGGPSYDSMTFYRQHIFAEHNEFIEGKDGVPVKLFQKDPELLSFDSVEGNISYSFDLKLVVHRPESAVLIHL